MPKCCSNSFHSSSLGICHPVGHTPCTPLGLLLLLTAPFIAALEIASGTKAIIFGKPSSAFFQTALDLLEQNAIDTLMIGDDIRSDIRGAQQLGIKGVLVHTGKFSTGDLNHDIKPAFLTIHSKSQEND